MKICSSRGLPWLFVGLCTAAVALWIASATPWPLNDVNYYQAFAERLASGHLDFSIIGFHGADIVAALWHKLFPAQWSVIHFQRCMVVFLPLLAFCAARSVLRDLWAGVLFAAIITMMPFTYGVALIGYTQPFYVVTIFLALIAASRSSRWTGLPWGFAMITKPFGVAIAPLLLILGNSKRSWWRWILLGLSIPALYLLLEYLQTGHIAVGVHPEFTPTNIWHGPRKFFLNLAYTLQILFSIHNFHYPNPAGTGYDNLIHTSPVLMMLGVFAILKPQSFFHDRRIPMALAAAAAINFVLNAAMGTMDHSYMEVGVLMLVLASLPVLKAYPLWIPIVLATLHFQFFYFYLWMGENMQLHWPFLAPVVVVDTAFMVWSIAMMWPKRKFFIHWMQNW